MIHKVHHLHPLSTVQMSQSQMATLLLLPALEVMSYAQEEVLHLTMKVAYLRQIRLILFQGLKLNKMLQTLLHKTMQRNDLLVPETIKYHRRPLVDL